ncbi:substrate-binding domain-containing protein [Paenibacillus harenae]|uniref:substrate-binding domain-containing protein n=1 Tax=Paenibacillus harenae TaxID=306543 RepID=UPI000417DB73|nr:substrate-binding domain-containing protein [Paenibacillus harenae]
MRKHRYTLWLVLAIIVLAVYAVFNFKFFSGVSHGERRVTVILETLNVQLDFWQAVHKGAEAAAKEMGLNVSVEGPLSEEGADAQIQILEAAIERKPHAIVIAPIKDDRMPAVLAKAREAGIKLVVIHSSPNMQPSPVVVSSNHFEAGRLAGQTSIKETNGHPVLALISDNENSAVSEERLVGMQLALADYKDSLMGIYYADQSEDRAYLIAKQLITSGSPINTFITLNESASLGVARVLKEQNRADDIRLIAFDSTGDEVQLLEAGIIKASIVQKPFNMGYLGVKTALKLIEGDKTNPITYMESNVITKENMYTTENQKLLFPFINSK